MIHKELFSIAQEYFLAKNITAAAHIVRHLLEAVPENSNVLSLWMLILSETNNAERAIALADRLLLLDPENILAISTKGKLLGQKGDRIEAASLLEKAGTLMIAEDHVQEALSLWQRSVHVTGQEPMEQWVALAERQKAILSRERMLILWKYIADLFLDKAKNGALLKYLGDLICEYTSDQPCEEVIDLYKTAYDSGEKDPEICYRTGWYLASFHRYDESVFWLKKLDGTPYEEKSLYWKAMALLHSGQASQRDINRLFDAWGRGFFANSAPRPPMPPMQRPLRLGFCSTHLGGGHYFDRYITHLAPALVRRGVEVRLYILKHENPSALCDIPGCQWIPLSHLGWKEKAQEIRKDHLHALIELDWIPAGFSIPAAFSLELYKNSPAPLTVSEMHVISSLGGAIDCLLMNECFCPPGAEADFFESVVRTKDPTSFTPPDPRAPAVVPPCLDKGFVTFGSFNRPDKLYEKTLKPWVEVMEQVANSRLLLRSSYFTAYETNRVAQILQRLGLSQERFEILGATDLDDFLVSYDRVDIALDPLPFNGGLTSIDALWQGVPVFTCPGHLVVGRMGAALLTAIGRTEWIAQDLSDWKRLVLDAASNPEQLHRWRFELRSQISRSILCDAERRADAFLGALTPLIDERYATASRGRAQQATDVLRSATAPGP